MTLGLRTVPSPSHVERRRTSWRQFLEPDKKPSNENEPSKACNSILSRFIAPTIDDPYLPLSDALVAQIIAPSLQIAWLSLNHAPQPTWLRPVFQVSSLYTSKGSLLAPTLIHGAALASCWIVGALAARAYERDALAPDIDNGYANVLVRVIQAGAFATGLLIMSTQLDLFLEYKGTWVQPGDSEEIDFRLLTAAVELINDVFFEATTIITWRLYLASQSRPLR